MSNGSQTARINAVRTLAKIGDERALPVLLAALDEDSSLMVYWANEGLTRMDLGMVYFQP
jgi:HEAT repeat protein